MKTISKKSAEKRLEKLNLNKTSKVYEYVKRIIDGEKTIRPNYILGSGRYISLHEFKNQLCVELSKMQIEYTCSNDAPRNGKCGELVSITTKIK